jgi:hypothetical protein
MTTINGVIHGKIIELEQEPGLPDGQIVAVTIQQIAPASSLDKPNNAPTPRDNGGPSIEEVLASLAAKVPAEDWSRLPVDLTDDLDHYIYGTPKK